MRRHAPGAESHFHLFQKLVGQLARPWSVPKHIEQDNKSISDMKLKFEGGKLRVILGNALQNVSSKTFVWDTKQNFPRPAK